jgi:nucleotide-binding universal stress UspA family protein
VLFIDTGNNSRPSVTGSAEKRDARLIVSLAPGEFFLRSRRVHSMATHVLVALDGSQQSWAAFDHAVSNYDGETITTLHVVDPMEGVYSDYGGGGYYDAQAHDRAVDRGEALGEQARTRADDAGILEATTLETAVETGPPARTILKYVDENDVDHVIMGSHGRSGVARVLLGSVAETVTRRSPVPVTIVR